MNSEIDQLLEKAKRSLEAARVLLKRGDEDFAVSRSYYALFYLSEALLLSKGRGFSSHKAVISGIFEHFIKTKELAASFHQTLHRAFDLRQKCDYLSTTEITKEIAMSLLDDVEREAKRGMHLFTSEKR